MNPTPNEVPVPPEGYRIIPREWVNAGNLLPGDTLFSKPGSGWYPSGRVGRTGDPELIYATRVVAVVCLCGSSKWPELHHRVMMEETLAGRIVIPMGLYGHADYPAGAKAATNDGDESTSVKQMLDTLHYRKIDLAHEILVVRVDGYVGSSTQREIKYAEKNGKLVRYFDYNTRAPLPASVPAEEQTTAPDLALAAQGRQEIPAMASRTGAVTSVPSGGAAEHNPDGLTPEQYGAPEWRLLRVDENVQPDDEFLHLELGRWMKITSDKVSAIDPDDFTHRRRVTPAPAPMGETPETDAVIEKSQFQNRLVMLMAHARKLESERAKALADLSALREKADALAAALKKADDRMHLIAGSYMATAHGEPVSEMFKAIEEMGPDMTEVTQALTAYTGKETTPPSESAPSPPSSGAPL